jgi:radical SAM superfamily enzyme YgiQ (UPF0313 family)
MPSNHRVAFLARDLVWADKSGGSLAFSYAARKLEASIRSAPDLGDVETTVIDLQTDEPEAFFEKIQAFRPTIVAASAYVWSIKIFCEVADLVRRWDPSIRFVMGGPAARPSLLSLAPYAPHLRSIDAVVAGEGEEIVRNLARGDREADWGKTVAGLQIPGPLGWRRTPDIERPVLDSYASPYQLGTAPHGGIGYLETFRGCPISCAFCQWGTEKSDRVHSVEYIAAHLRGLQAANATKLFVLDAGFNLSARAFRNLVEAERQVGWLKHSQVLGHLYPTHLKDEHLEFFDSFRRADITIGVQSFDPAVLKKLGRPFDLPRFYEVLGEINGRFDIDIEIIIGLPGDDAASFRRTFEQVIELATTVRVFYCLALPDALLERAEEFDVVFDPDTFQVKSCRGWTAESLANEWAYVRQIASTMHRPNYGPNWLDFRTELPSAGGKQNLGIERSAVAADLVERAQRSAAGSNSGWRLVDASREDERVLLSFEGTAGSLVLEATLVRPGHRCFFERDGIAYSHRGELPRGDGARVKEFIAILHTSIGRELFSTPLSEPAAAE